MRLWSANIVATGRSDFPNQISNRLALIIHERFYCNREYAAATGGLAAQSVTVLLMSTPPSLAAPSARFARRLRGFVTNRQEQSGLVFPGMFRGALDVRATAITFEMEQAAAQALADVIPESDLRPDYIIPDAFDFRVPPAVAAAVARSAMETGVARIQRDPDAIARDTRAFLYEGELGSL